MVLAEALRRAAQAHPEKIAFVHAHQRLSYAQWLNCIDRVAGGLLARGLQPGDRLAFYAASSTNYVLTLWACFRTGIIAVPLNSHHLASELQPVLRHIEPAALFTDKAHAAKLQSITLPKIIIRDEEKFFSELLTATPYVGPDPPPDALALILYTSGTTGQPKGVAHRQASITSHLFALHRLWQLSTDDVVLHALPLHHVHGLLISMASALLAGSTLLFHSRFDAATTLNTLYEQKVTAFMGVPTMYYRLLQQPGPSRFPHMRLFVCGSAPLPQPLAQAFFERFGLPLLERAGMTETLMIFANKYGEPPVAGSVGKPLPGVQVRLIDDSGRNVDVGSIGEIWIKSPYMFKEYWKNHQATADAFCNGWFRTGDMGRCDQNGNYFIVGRKKEIIKSGGILIFPSEIESVLLQMPGVADCAVVGIPDAEFGERIKACVVVTKPLTAEDIIQYCRQHLASYKKPAVVAFYDVLPRNAMGKIDRAALKNQRGP